MKLVGLMGHQCMSTQRVAGSNAAGSRERQGSEQKREIGNKQATRRRELERESQKGEGLERASPVQYLRWGPPNSTTFLPLPLPPAAAGAPSCRPAKPAAAASPWLLAPAAEGPQAGGAAGVAGLGPHAPRGAEAAVGEAAAPAELPRVGPVAAKPSLAMAAKLTPGWGGARAGSLGGLPASPSASPSAAAAVAAASSTAAWSSPEGSRLAEGSGMARSSAADSPVLAAAAAAAAAAARSAFRRRASCLARCARFFTRAASSSANGASASGGSTPVARNRGGGRGAGGRYEHRERWGGSLHAAYAGARQSCGNTAQQVLGRLPLSWALDSRWALQPVGRPTTLLGTCGITRI